MATTEPSQWRFFRLAEFACKHCGENLIRPDFITKLDRLRAALGFVMVVSSGYRCPIHNQAVSKTGLNGPHTTGRAADFRLSHFQAFELVRVAMSSGAFTGIGVKQHGATRFVHLDDLHEPEHRPRPTLWTYA